MRTAVAVAALVAPLVAAAGAALFLRGPAVERRGDDRRSAAEPLAELPDRFPPSPSPRGIAPGTSPPAPPGTIILRHRGPGGVTVDTLPVLGARPPADGPGGIPVPFGVPAGLPSVECPMAVQRMDSTRFAPMPVARAIAPGSYRMQIVQPKCRNPLF